MLQQFNSSETPSASKQTLLERIGWRRANRQSSGGSSSEAAPVAVSEKPAGWVLKSVFAVSVLLALAAISWKVSHLLHHAATPQSLGLRVTRDASDFVLTWSVSAPELSGAKSARLKVSEGGAAFAILDLSPEEFRKGRLTYGSSSFHAGTEFRLEVVGADGSPIEESALISPGPDDGLTRSSAESARSQRIYAKRRLARPANEASDVPESAGATSKESSMLSSVPAQPQQIRSFSPPAEAPRSSASPVLFEPPPVGRLLLPWTTLPMELASYALANRSVPPATTRVENGSPQRETAPSNSGMLRITSEPSGATVRIDDSYAGVTPLSLQISPIGMGFTVTLNKSGFTKWSIQSVAIAQPYELHAQLTPR